MHTPTMSSSIRHVAVMVDGSAAAERALLEAAAIADEHGADLTVIAPVPHDRRTDGSAVRAVRRAAWNRTLDAAAEADLANARALLGEREPEPRYRAVSGSVSPASAGRSPGSAATSSCCRGAAASGTVRRGACAGRLAAHVAAVAGRAPRRRRRGAAQPPGRASSRHRRRISTSTSHLDEIGAAAPHPLPSP